MACLAELNRADSNLADYELDPVNQTHYPSQPVVSSRSRLRRKPHFAPLISASPSELVSESR